MSKFKFYIIIIVTAFSNIISVIGSQNLEVTPLQIHFNGSVSSRSNILIYGSCGSYLISKDQCKNWEQRSIGDVGNIQKILNYNDTLWGITDNGIIINSLNYGISWNLFDQKLDIDNYFVNFDISDNFLFVRSKNRIYKYDKNTKLINTLTDSSLLVRKSISSNKFNNQIYENYTNSFLKFYDGKLFISFNKDKNKKVLILDDNLKQINEIDLSTFIKTPLFYTTDDFSFIDLFIIDGQLIFNFSGCLYKSNKDISKFEYFFNDTLYMNRQYKSDLEWGAYMRNYSEISNNLFQSKLQFSTSSNFPDTITITIFDKLVNKFKDYNLPFINKYYQSRVTKESIIGNYKYNYEINPIYNFIGKTSNYLDSIFIIENENKTLLVSTNYCKSWKLVSSLNAEPTQIVDDSTFIFINKDTCKSGSFKYFENYLYISNNSGQTFEPIYNQKDTMNLLKLNMFLPEVVNFDKSGFGILSGQSLSTLDFMTKEKQKALITYDNCKTNKFIENDMFNGTFDFPSQSSNVISIDNKILFALNNKLNNYKNEIYLIDKNLLKTQTLEIDSLSYIHFIDADNLNHYRLIASEYQLMDTTYKNTVLFETIDSGKTRSIVYNYKRYFNFDKLYKYNNDLILFTCKNQPKLYSMNLISYEIDTLFEKLDSDYLCFFQLGTKLFLFGNGFIYENTSKTNLKEWSPLRWDYGTPIFESVIFKDNTAIATLSDSLRKKNYYRITLKSTTDIIENPKNEVLYYSKQFYASDPYPLPSTTKVTSIISFDLSYDIWESIDGIYDIFGAKIEGKENIKLTSESKYTARLDWNCSSVLNGTYFILINHNGTTDCIPVLVNK